MLLASGEIRTYSRESNSDLFPAILCSLGCLGIILTAKIQCEKAFRLEQIEYSAKLEDVCDLYNSFSIDILSVGHSRSVAGH
jgi:L-gulonolactone oxidase